MSLQASIHARLQQAQQRHEEIAALLATQEVMADQNRFRELSVEYAQLEPVVSAWSRWQQLPGNARRRCSRGRVG